MTKIKDDSRVYTRAAPIKAEPKPVEVKTDAKKAAPKTAAKSRKTKSKG